MKPRKGKRAFAVIIILALAGAALFFLSRPPVLIVTDASFAALYGPRRLLLARIRASLLLARPVQPVMIAADAGADLLAFAIEEAVSRPIKRRPYCVLSPRRYAEGARRYGEQFPGIPVALLAGRAGPGDFAENSGNFFVFGTDMEQDLYRAGRCAAVLGGKNRGRILVFQDRFAQMTGQEAFTRGLREEKNETIPEFLSALSDSFDSAGISCAVLAGSGAAYLDQNLPFPVVLFTWLDPGVSGREAAVIFDDSPWALAIPAARAIAANRKQGRIPSDLLIIPAKIADKDILRQLKKTVRSVQQKTAE